MRKKPVQQRSRQMVESIIEAAGRVVAEEGLDALTTNRVAAVAGISNGSLYQYFHDSDDLLEALVEKTSQDIMQMLNQHRQQIDVSALDLRATARLALTVVMAFMRAKPLYLELIRHWNRMPLQRFLDPMEQYILAAAQQHLLTTNPDRHVDDFQVRGYLLFNGAVFNLLRYISQGHPFIPEDKFLDMLAENIELFMSAGMRGSQQSPAQIS